MTYIRTILSSLYLETRILFTNSTSYLPAAVLRNYRNLLVFIKQRQPAVNVKRLVTLPVTPVGKASHPLTRLHVWVRTYLDFALFRTQSRTNSIFYVLSAASRRVSLACLDITLRSFGPGFFCLVGLFIIGFVDSLITDDEPIWEPIEWSLIQTWLMFIFLFAWIAENLITSRYGSYTGRDKRVWFSWFKTFWLIEGWYTISLGLAALFVITPFYHEVTYPMPFMVSWWNWYSQAFMFKFTHNFTLLFLLAYYLQVTLRWANWKTSFVLILFINFVLAQLLYYHFFFTLFGYLTDPNWFAKNRTVDYIQLSHEPNKWAWGPSSRDHFTYHRSTTVFWFKNDTPFAGALMFFHINFFILLFFLNFYWLTLLRRVYATQEITWTYTIYCISALRQFFIFFLALHSLIFFSYVLNYWGFPIEFMWILNPDSWFVNFWSILRDYPQLLWFIYTK